MKTTNVSTLLIESSADVSELVQWGGGKAANLARLTRIACPVPEWFCVSSLAFDEFVRENALDEKLKPAPPFKDFAEKVEAAFLSYPLPERLRTAIADKLVTLGLADTFVAVRSSGLDEDSADNSFAGQFSSYLFQKGMPAIEDSLKRCWASGFSERALSYRVERGLGLLGIRVGVVIQKMVNADSAGVVFSRNPIKVLERNSIVVSSVWGLGEGLVSGALESDNFDYDRVTGKIKKEIVKKSDAFRQAPAGGLVTVPLHDSKKEAASLTDAEVTEVARLSAHLEEKLGAPQDSEWAYENGKLYVVQTRPVTNLPPAGFFDPKVNGKSPILWDNSNIIESYSGVTSPLTFSFASRAYHQVYVQFCEVMGVPQELVAAKDSVLRNMLGLIRGRIYYNLINWYQLVLMLPGSSNNKGFMDTMMGVKSQLKPEHATLFDFVKNPPRYSLGARVRILALTVWRFLKIDSIVKDFQSHFNRVYDQARKQDFRALSLAEQLDYYHYLDTQILRRWHAPIINDYLCMLFFGLLKKLTEKWVGGTEDLSSLQNDLLCGEGGLDSTEPTKMLMRIAERVDNGDRQFRSWFLATSSEDAWAAIRTGSKGQEIRGEFLEFLDRFGFRCVNELKLEEPDLHDDPTFVINSVASYVRTTSYKIGDMETRERAIRDAAEKKVLTKLTGFRRGVYFWVLRQARRAVKNRENLRFARTKIFGVSRHLFRAMGSHLEALGILEDSKDIFYLSVDEIVAFIEGRGLTAALKPLIAIRKQEFREFNDTPPPPDRLLTLGAVGPAQTYNNVLAESDLLRGEEDLSADPNVLKGTPCCPGVIEGVVRVVTNLKDAEGIAGEILVTSRTDPGWVPLYPSCSGLLIERGSLLSHSAVVARELGLPTIVGISGGLMTRLKTGQRVRVDAGKGEVRIL